MSGYERINPEDESAERRGDDTADAHHEGFAVYGGSPKDREALQSGGYPLGDIDDFLLHDLGGYGRGTSLERPTSRTPLDDKKDEVEQQ